MGSTLAENTNYGRSFSWDALSYGMSLMSAEVSRVPLGRFHRCPIATEPAGPPIYLNARAAAVRATVKDNKVSNDLFLQERSAVVKTTAAEPDTRVAARANG